MIERSLSSRIWRGFLLLLAIVVVLGHAVFGWTYSSRIIDDVLTPPATIEPLDSWVYQTPEEAGLTVREIEYDTPLGPMDAWISDGTRAEWVIHVHGEGADRAQALRAMQILDEAGYHQMVITYRNDPGQPPDPSGQLRFGVTERDDLAAAVVHARGQGAEDIVLFGYSAGAAIAQAYAIRQPLGTIRAMVFDSPNLQVEEAVDVRASNDDLVFGLPVPPTVTATAKFFAALRSDINWQNYDYVARSDAISMPVLVFHGSEDEVVPLSVSTDFAQERPDAVRLVVVDGAGHVEAWNVDPTSYAQALTDFLER